ncbi:hypothetical protein [Paracoccus sp. (in: a-proteobacteria)]|uniref:hypothetical protein n=1 Tax=Paracoccus sp. TaxID=267 RepID=UPI003220237F
MILRPALRGDVPAIPAFWNPLIREDDDHFLGRGEDIRGSVVDDRRASLVAEAGGTVQGGKL